MGGAAMKSKFWQKRFNILASPAAREWRTQLIDERLPATSPLRAQGHK
jgi:hypothetical protein